MSKSRFRLEVGCLFPEGIHASSKMHRQVRLHKLYSDLLRTPTGPLIHQMVPDAAWVYRLMCWRKVKLMVIKFGIARYWKSLCSPAPA